MDEISPTTDPIALFREAAMAKGDGVGLPAARDHALHAEMSRAAAIMRAEQDQGLAALKKLAHDPSPHVRQWAAAELLSRGDTSVIPHLEELATERGLHRLTAEMVLKEYRAGPLTSPFPSPAP
jgi:hypothetical protein